MRPTPSINRREFLGLSAAALVNWQAAKPTDAKATIDAAIEKEINAGLFPGAVVLIGKPGQTLYHEAFGYARVVPDKVKMRKDSIFDLASITKAAAAGTACAVCYDRGLIELDAPVTKYLLVRGKGTEGLTLRHLATHTSGYQVVPKVYELAKEQNRDMFSALLNASCKYPVGEKEEYSCFNAIMLSMVVAAVTRREFGEFCIKEIYQPLGMRDTGFYRVPVTERAVGNSRQNKLGPNETGLVENEDAQLAGRAVGNAGLWSSAADMARLCEMWVNGGTLGNVKLFSKRTAETRTPPLRPGMRRGFLWSIGGPSWMSPQTFGHGGHTGARILIDPVKRLYAVVLSNRNHPVHIVGARANEQRAGLGRITDAALAALGY